MSNRPCLPVPRRRKRQGTKTTSSNDDFGDIATMDASEYLSRVIQQSKQLPDVLVTQQQQQTKKKKKKQRCLDVPIDGSAASVLYLISDRTVLVPPPSARHLPPQTETWIQQTLANFTQLRTYLTSMKQPKPNRKQPVPPMSDRPAWHIFCLGETEARGNVGDYYCEDDNNKADENPPKAQPQKLENLETKISTNEETTRKDEPAKAKESSIAQDPPKTTQDDDIKEDQTTTVEEPWRHNLPPGGYEATTSLLLQLDQVLVRRVIAHLAHYICHEDYRISSKRSLWLYALLACLEKPIHRNEAAVLYSLLKTLTHRRASMTMSTTTNDPLLAHINTLIVLVALYFEQGDRHQVMTVQQAGSS
ncbi:Survival motor neuron (SMN) interacting protein 1 (SIP1) [Seminavis robusta]|uniref:Survival motor neuron (SMN) interacting protein 1 (SIP1) n=1 Tax=Seminavis robusta TaxID=568900 RepID=A0A9N8EUR7_9STRA|nr:Survival motor neuron (SMN) interacting protein 1 (SIP1) [Seminavis robusta]|eukprot:Sro1820_g299740.1 Survival motor neuron (SMN) interacting protein 1 (SIP1) (362) ;mRNA; r:19459-20544